MFWLVSVIALCILLLAIKVIPKDTISYKEHANFNYMGALLYLITFGVFQYWLKVSMDNGFLEVQSIVSLVVTLLALVLFLVHEKGREDQVIPFSLFKLKTFFCFSMIALLIMTVVQGLFYLLPIYFSDVHLFTPGQIGMLLMIEAIVVAVLASK